MQKFSPTEIEVFDKCQEEEIVVKLKDSSTCWFSDAARYSIPCFSSGKYLPEGRCRRCHCRCRLFLLTLPKDISCFESFSKVAVCKSPFSSGDFLRPTNMAGVSGGTAVQKRNSLLCKPSSV